MEEHLPVPGVKRNKLSLDNSPFDAFVSPYLRNAIKLSILSLIVSVQLHSCSLLEGV
jgi:hypothetical protein